MELFDKANEWIGKAIYLVFGNPSEKIIKRLAKRLPDIVAWEHIVEKYTDRQLKLETYFFRQKIAAIRAETEGAAGETAVDAYLTSIIPQAFAICRETAKRTLGMRHYDVQALGAMALHDGNIAEMITGEGKTLVSTLASYLNALGRKGRYVPYAPLKRELDELGQVSPARLAERIQSEGLWRSRLEPSLIRPAGADSEPLAFVGTEPSVVHVITVNDYLARRDGSWNAPLFNALGITVGVIQSKMKSEDRHHEYKCDITYGTNNEFGFDYLRDNMKMRSDDQIQKRRHFAVIDEVDSILIDEARTPLIISGGPDQAITDKYMASARLVQALQPVPQDEIDKKTEQMLFGNHSYEPKAGHYIVEEKDHAVTLTARGIREIERRLGWRKVFDREDEESGATESADGSEKSFRDKIVDIYNETEKIDDKMRDDRVATAHIPFGVLTSVSASLDSLSDDAKPSAPPVSTDNLKHALLADDASPFTAKSLDGGDSDGFVRDVRRVLTTAPAQIGVDPDALPDSAVDERLDAARALIIDARLRKAVIEFVQSADPHYLGDREKPSRDRALIEKFLDLLHSDSEAPDAKRTVDSIIRRTLFTVFEERRSRPAGMSFGAYSDDNDLIISKIFNRLRTEAVATLVSVCDSRWGVHRDVNDERAIFDSVRAYFRGDSLPDDAAAAVRSGIASAIETVDADAARRAKMNLDDANIDSDDATKRLLTSLLDDIERDRYRRAIKAAATGRDISDVAGQLEYRILVELLKFAARRKKDETATSDSSAIRADVESLVKRRVTDVIRDALIKGSPDIDEDIDKDKTGEYMTARTRDALMNIRVERDVVDDETIYFDEIERVAVDAARDQIAAAISALPETETETDTAKSAYRSFYHPDHMDWAHYIENALKAKELYSRGDEYVVDEDRDGRMAVIIIDEFTGRKMYGRRWSDGLHQAVEVKEKLFGDKDGRKIIIRGENQTFATITLQNFFKLYDKISGMTGTAATEAAEFGKVYKLEVVVVPTNRPLKRISHNERIYGTTKEKFDALIKEIDFYHQIGRPMLIGTTSVEKSELLAALLIKAGYKDNTAALKKKNPGKDALDNDRKFTVLNAKEHEYEARIVERAGELGAITIATNMAGRGTDIKLGTFTQDELIAHWKRTGFAPESLDLSWGKDAVESALFKHWAAFVLTDKNGNPLPKSAIKDIPAAELKKRVEKEFVAQAGIVPSICRSVSMLGGLHIVGTERHESQRIDNQLKGRAGRQGDPGSNRFFLSLEDDLMRKFAKDWVKGFLQRAGLSGGAALESRMVSRSVQKAQQRVEEYNYAIRRNLVEYDEVMNRQRQYIYDLRQKALEGRDLRETTLEWLEQTSLEAIERVYDETFPTISVIAASVTEMIDEAMPEDRLEDDLALPESSDERQAKKKLTGASPLESLLMQVERTYGVVIESPSVQSLDRESLRDHIIDKIVAHYDALDEDDYKSEMAARWAAKHFDLDIDPKAIRADNAQDSFDKLFKEISARYEKREADAGEYIRRDPQTNEVIEREKYMRQIERFLILKFIDELWKDHLLDMDQLKSGIGLRSYAQKDPKEEFKREGGDLFDKLIVSLMEKYTFFLFRAERSERISQSEVDSVWQESDQTTRHDSVQSVYSAAGGGAGAGGDSHSETERHEPEKTQTIVKKDLPKIGPNDRCPCGSGKKFKKCHGRPGAAPVTAEQIASWKTNETPKSE